LCEGEKQHSTVADVVKGWQRIGGGLYITSSVLEEIAHHAWISEHEYHELSEDLHNYSETDATRYINNAFVKSFWKIAKGRYSKINWKSYIGNFRGLNHYDYSKIQQDYESNRFYIIDEDYINKDISHKISAEISSIRTKNINPKDQRGLLRAEDKSKRDGKLLAVLMKHRLERNKQGCTGIIVSSSGLLKKYCISKKEIAGSAVPIMPISAVAYLLALIPEVRISLNSMKQVLFDAGITEHVSSIQRKALRIIKRSDQYSLPFSRRHTLNRELMANMTQLAVERGQKTKELIEDVDTDEEIEAKTLMPALSDAIDKIEKSKYEKIIMEKDAKIQELQNKLEKEQRKKK
jgi:hypothetical protein